MTLDFYHCMADNDATGNTSRNGASRRCVFMPAVLWPNAGSVIGKAFPFFVEDGNLSLIHLRMRNLKSETWNLNLEPESTHIPLLLNINTNDLHFLLKERLSCVHVGVGQL